MQPTSGQDRNRHLPRDSSAVVREAQRQALVPLLEQGDRLLEVVLALAGDPELVALDLGLHLEAGLADGLGQGFGLVLGDAAGLGSVEVSALSDTDRFTSLSLKTSRAARARWSVLETITTSSPDQASEVPVFLKSKRCASSFLAWLTALSTS
jgi:hypothetical protein